MSNNFFVVVAIELFALITGIYFLKQIRGQFLFLFVFVLVSFFTEILKPIMYYGFDIRHNLWLSHFYFPLEFLFLSLFYKKELDRFFNRKWFTGITLILILFSIVNPIFIQDLTEYSKVRPFSSILLVVFSILYFYRIMTESKICNLANEPMIWINTAVLLYYAGSLFYNALFTLILEYSRDFSKFSGGYFKVLNMLFYLLITVGFWKAGKLHKTGKGNIPGFCRFFDHYLVIHGLCGQVLKKHGVVHPFYGTVYCF